MIKTLTLAAGALLMSACSVFGEPGVEIAPYSVIEKDEAIEVRHYPELVLVSTPMDGGVDESQRGSFGRLFDYISGENISATKIPMTAPVFMGEDENVSEGQEIPMTAPVFMGDNGGQKMMSFVLPADMSFDEAPKPKNPAVRLEKIEDYTVGTITFSGFLSESNIKENRLILESWLAKNGYNEIGVYKSAGYNAPWTLPMARRNEVLIPVEKK